MGRVIPWTENVKAIILRRLRKDTEFIFPNQRGNRHMQSNKRAWNRAKQLAGIKGRARWHDIRGTALTAAVFQEKKSIHEVSKVAGLSVRTMEKVYVQPNVDQLRNAVGAITCDAYMPTK
jgi:hypothetical protein